MTLREVLNEPKFSREQKIGSIIVELGGACTVKDIRLRALEEGFHEIESWNVHNIVRNRAFKKIKGKVVVTVAGKASLRLPETTSRVSASDTRAIDLRRHILQSKLDAETEAFLIEAVACYEQSLFRSAVVLSWVGAVSVLHKYVAAKHLQAFNTEAQRRDSKWRPAKNTDGLSRMGEHDFLDVLEAISVIGKNVKQELQNKALTLRNACGHPNSLHIGERVVAAHLELLLLNVFSKF